MSDTKFAVYQQKETIMESWCKNIVGLLVLGFLIAFAAWADSIFWTFITGGMGLMWICGKIREILGQSNRFETKEDLQKWVDSIK
tara:strand:+ start:565 stop:819 length:255 start_codon:yes stop_codon:yes gene_type:complete